MKLKQELNLFDVFCIASGAMISSGLFVLPGLAYQEAGPGFIVSYIIAGALALIGVLSIAALTSALPKAGGTYFLISRSLGPAMGTVEGFISWFSLSLKSAFALVGMAAFTKLIINLDIHFIAIILTILFVTINLLGVKETGRLQVGLVVGLLAILAFYILKGATYMDMNNFKTDQPSNWWKIFSTSGFVFVSYGGLIKIAAIAEEVKRPGKNIPLGMLLSLGVVGLFYIGVSFVTTGLLGHKLAGSLTPISDGAEAFMGLPGKILLAIAAILAFVSTANAGILSASRYPMALSRDRLLPDFLTQISSRFKTPHYSIFITGLFMIIALILQLDVLVKAASTVLILTYIFSCISLIVMRESKVQNYQPKFKAPLYPYLQIIGIAGFGYILFSMGWQALLMAGIIIIISLSVYFLYGKVRASREYALLHLIERITAKDLTNYSLESELKEIIRQRDDMKNDRFDDLIEHCTVLDIEDNISLTEFSYLVADEMAHHLEISTDTFLKLLTKKEREVSTVLYSHIAIPHIIIEGKNKFDILIARAKNGVKFSEQNANVEAVFVLAGTIDERPFHLRALASIAQIVQQKDFRKRWLKAKNDQALRDLILLSDRRRYHD